MCKYCEEVVRTRGTKNITRIYETCQEYGEESYLIRYSDGRWELSVYAGVEYVDEDDDEGIERYGYLRNITYCPWCGRKLEVPEEEEDFSAEDEVARLEGRINYTNTKIGQLLDTIIFLMEMLDRGQVNHNNIDIVKNKLKNIKDSLCHD